jgi:DNA-binding MarR family transcriptional regulator
MIKWSQIMEFKTSPISTLSNDNVLNVDLQMCFALYSASLSMTKAYKPLLAELKLTYPQYLVLLVLWEKDAVAVNVLGERLFSDSGTLTPLLKRLEKLGFIQRQRSAEDERRVIVTLTKEGKQLQKKAAAIPVQMLCNTGCTLTEIQQLNSQLISLRTALIKNSTIL